MDTPYLVSAEWLKKNLDNEGLKIVEAPWKEHGFTRAHIKGARCLPCHSYLKCEDMDGNRLPHVFESGAFRKMLAELGINANDNVVVYDDFHGLFSGRFWWVCNYYGFSGVKVLNGGWHAWVDKGYPITTAYPDYPRETDFEPDENHQMKIDLNELKEAVDQEAVKIWDTRRTEEFYGTEKTNNKRKGHIPNAINIEWKQMLTEEVYPGGPRYLKSLEEMEEILVQADLKKPDSIITLCQASIRGAFGSLVLAMLGYPKHKLYDAAMAEWANRDDTPLKTRNA